MMQTAGFQHVEMNQFSDWMASAFPGDVMVYGIGDLAWSKRAAAESKDSGLVELIGVASMAYEASEGKRVCLTQRRIGDQTFEYLATKRAAASKSKDAPARSRGLVSA